MTEAQAKEAIGAAFVAGMVSTRPDVPLSLENEAIAAPASGSYATLTIAHTASRQETQGEPGARLDRHDGWITVKLWTPAGVGTQDADVLAGTVRRMLELRDYASPVAGDEALTTLSGVVQPGGTDGRWYMLLVRVPFWYLETV